MRRARNWVFHLKDSVWLFPVACLVALVFLTSLQIQGSSIGMYYKDLYGPNSHDPNLIAGSPRSIRSDEWEWQTNMTIAQAKSGFPKENHNIGLKQNMEATVDVPYKDWSVAFKPQNLAFFILPISYAFALKWWFLAFLLITSVYLFTIMLLPKRRILAAILSVAFFFSPFIQWWYQTITIAPIAYGFLTIVVSAALWKSRGRNKLLWSALLAYVLTCFAVVFYPPFQIPCAIVAGVTLLAYFMDQRLFKDKKQRRSGFLHIALSLFVFTFLAGSFLVVNKAALRATQNSIYPGRRISHSGYFDGKIFMGNFLDSQLQLSRKAVHYVANQSEAANFLLFAPFLSLPALYWLYNKYRKSRKTDWLLLASTGLFLLFMVRLFVPKTDLIFKPLLLEHVPNNRLLIGVGMVGFIQLIAFIRFLGTKKVPHIQQVAVITAIVAFVANLSTGLLIRRDYPAFVHLLPLILLLALIPSLIIYTLLSRRFTIAAIGLLFFSFISSAGVNPVYRGIGVLHDSEIVRAVSVIAQKNKNARWVVVDNIVYENLPVMAGAASATGIYSYPQTNFWSQATDLHGQEDIYNRFAHTQATFDATSAHLRLKQADFFEIVGSPCSPAFKQLGVRFFLAEKDYTKTYSCLASKQVITYPNKTFYISELP